MLYYTIINYDYDIGQTRYISPYFITNNKLQTVEMEAVPSCLVI